MTLSIPPMSEAVGKELARLYRERYGKDMTAEEGQRHYLQLAQLALLALEYSTRKHKTNKATL